MKTLLLLGLLLPFWAKAADTNATMRVLAIQQVNQHWDMSRSAVENNTLLKQKNPIEFGTGERAGLMNVHCVISTNQPRPEFILIRFQRAGAKARWEDYRRVIVNRAGVATEWPPDNYKLTYLEAGCHEQMWLTLTLSEFRTWAKSDVLLFSVCGEEFTLTAVTLDKWRALLTYVDLTATASQPKK